MNVALVLAGSLGIVAAAIHGGAGERLVVRKLTPQALPASAFGGPRMTMAMIHVTWHMTTVAYLILGAALLLAGTALDGDAERAVGVVGAAAFTGFGLLGLGLGVAHTRSARSLLRHPGPLLLTVTGALAWWGAV